MRALRAVSLLARVLGTLIVFAVALVAGVALHVGVPAEQRVVVDRVNRVLAPLFVGTLTIERLRSLSLGVVGGVGGVDARVNGPDGALLLRATGIDGRIALATLVRSLLGGSIAVELPAASIEGAELNLDADADGVPLLADAFLPRAPSPPGTPVTPVTPVRVSIPKAHVGHLAVRGKLASLPPIDGDLDGTDGSFSFAQEKILIDVTRSQWLTRRFAGGPDARGEAEGHLALPSATGHLGLHVTAHGTVGDVNHAAAPIAVQADAAYDGGQIDATLDVPAAAPDQVRALRLSWPLQAPIGIHAEAHGTLPKLDAKVHATLAGATVDVDGPVTVGPAVQASLRIDARRLDAHAIALEAPPSALDVAGGASFTLQPGAALDSRVALELAAGSFAGTPTPAMAVTAHVTRTADPPGALEASANVTVRERGMPIEIAAHLTPTKRSFALSFHADASARDLTRVRGLGGVVQGKAVARADGVVDFGTRALDATVSASGEALHAAGAEAQAARVEVHASGPMAAPVFDVAVVGEGFEVWRLQCPWLQGSARIGVAGGVTLQDVDLSTRASDQRAHARVRRVQVVGDDVRVEDAMVTGFGAPVGATVRYAPGYLYVQAKSGDLDLTRIARFVQVSDVRRGDVSFDIDATVTHGHAEGHVRLDLTKGAIGEFNDATVRVDATLHGRQAAGRITADVPKVGSIDVQSSSIQVGEEGPLSLRSWRRAWGTVDAKAHLDLPALDSRLPSGSLPVSLVAGVLDLDARIDRDSMNDATPAVNATLETKGLILKGGGNPPSTPPWRIEGIDPAIYLTVDGDNGATALELELHDATGTLARLNATSNDVPYAKIASGDGLVEGLLTMPIDATLAVPERAIESLPPVLGLTGLKGTVQATLEGQGSARQPKLHMTGSIVRGQTDPTLSALPVDLAMTADYDGQHATAQVQAMNKDKLVVDARVDVAARMIDVLGGFAGSVVPWTASARAKLDALPLRTFTWLSDRQVRGRLSGEIVLDRLHQDAKATTDLSIDGLAVGNITCKSAVFQATLDGHALDAAARVEQEFGGGFAEAKVKVGSHWGSALIPALDAAQAADVSLLLKHLRASLLLPFVSNLFTELDGQLDGDAGLTVDPGGVTARPRGTVQLADGTFELSSIGGEFGEASGKLVLSPDGLVRLEGFSARGLTGKLQVAATGRFAGLRFGGATATIQVPGDQAIPVVFDGVQLGTLDGRIDVTANAPTAEGALAVKVDAPTLHLALPTEATHDVQPLGDLENVTIGAYRSAGGFVEVPLDATVAAGGLAPRAPITITVHLGDDVTIRRGADVNVRMSGDPVVTIADTVTVVGQIRLVKGTIAVQGKPFDIEKGVITFDGKDPSNPQVVLTAGWTAPDQTRVYADFVGPLKTGKVTLRSDPVLPGGENDILSLILFGQTQSEQSGANTTVNSAASFAGAASAPVNQILGGLNRTLTKTGVSAKIDTSQANPMPEVQLQIARDISVRIGYVIGTPVFPNQDTTLVTLSWAFAKRWNLEGTGGNSGSAVLDFIWQHRY
jgi:translocation and assembly module TamB